MKGALKVIVYCTCVCTVFLFSKCTSTSSNKAHLEIDSLTYSAIQIIGEYPDSSYNLFQKALSKSEAINYWFGITRANWSLGFVAYSYKHNLELALYHYDQGLQVIDRIDAAPRNKFISKSLYNINEIEASLTQDIGLVLMNLDAYDDALAFYDSALNIVSKGDHATISIILKNKGVAYRKSGRLIEAIELVEESLRLSRKEELWHISALDWLELGLCHKELEDYENAREYFFNIIGNESVLGSKYNWLAGQAYHNVAYTYQLEKNYDKAIEYYSKAIDVFDKDGYSNDLVLAYRYQGQSLLEDGQLNAAINSYLKSVEYLNPKSIEINIIDTYYELSVLFDLSGNKDGEHKYRDLYKARIDYSNAIKKDRLALLNKNTARATLTRARKQEFNHNLMWPVIIGSVLLFVVAFYLLGMYYREAKKAIAKNKAIKNTINTVVKQTEEFLG